MLGFDRLAALGVLPTKGGRRQGGPVPRSIEIPVPGSGTGPSGKVGLRDLEDLCAISNPVEVLRYRNRPVLGLTDDSREVRPGGVFFAVPGHAEDGAAFASEALGRGAVAIVASRPLPVPLPLLVVEDVRRTAGKAAAAFFGDPSRSMPVLGVTGTNGKTTTARLCALCLEEEYGNVGVLGTVAFHLGRDASGVAKVLPADRTTPGPIAVQSLLREMRDRGTRAAVLEVSSHALDQGRCDSVRFKVAIFTNLSRDHLDYHGTMEAYARAKARLFAGLGEDAVAVLPSDDPSAAAVFESLPSGVRLATWCLGRRAGPGDLHVECEILSTDLRGSRLRLHVGGADIPLRLPLVGEHNVRNAVAAFTGAVALGIGPLRAAGALTLAPPVPGRLERMPTEGLGFEVLVDYAHSPDALAKVLASLRPLVPGRLLLVFGCGGDRDRGKRPRMGGIAARFADRIVLTNDNPRGEDPEAILRDILDGVPVPDRIRVDLCRDRRRAIRRALAEAREGDLVLIAGKGHEQGQEVDGRTIPFDDREEVRAWLQRN